MVILAQLEKSVQFGFQSTMVSAYVHLQSNEGHQLAWNTVVCVYFNDLEVPKVSMLQRWSFLRCLSIRLRPMWGALEKKTSLLLCKTC